MNNYANDSCAEIKLWQHPLHDR